MLERKISQKLIDWKQSQAFSKEKKALVIKGLRQVGKTYIIERFAEENYENFIKLDFKANRSLKEAFSGDLDVDAILMNLSLNIKTKPIPGKTLIFMDEIQECAAARASLKSFCVNGRYDVIASGSLLGLNGYNRSSSEGPSVGYELFLEMKGMDFEEFLWAKGVGKDVIAHIKARFEKRRPIDLSIHTTLLRYFREYLIVGGMPGIVKTFVESNSFADIRTLQKSLLTSYRDDFGRFLDKNENEQINSNFKTKLTRIFEFIPRQLAKDNKKFMYSSVDEKARRESYEEALKWLIDYGLVLPCYNLKKLELPLSSYEDDDFFKIYFADTGLFVSLLEAGSASDILNDNLGIYKGALFEELVACAFHKIDRPLYFFRKPSGLEIDFVIRYKGEVTLVEVKAKGGKTKSAATIMNDKKHYGISHLIRLTAQNISQGEGVLTLPYYLAYLLEEEF